MSVRRSERRGAARAHAFAAIAFGLAGVVCRAAAAPAANESAAPAATPHGVAGTSEAESATASAPGGASAAIVLEPPVLALGATAVADLVVSTPPGHVLRMSEPLPELPGVWLLSTRWLPVERGPARWIHRIRLDLRAREVGAFDWPSFSLGLERADGETESVEIAGRRIEVASSLALRAPSAGPFGLRSPAITGARDPLLPALAGALATLAALGLVALVRRERRRRGDGAAGDRALARTISGRAQASARLQEAHALAARDAVLAATHAAQALRAWLAELAPDATRALTLEELASGSIPFAVRSRWPRWLALLAELDDLRFVRSPAGAPARLEAAFVEAQALIDATAAASEREPPPNGSPGDARAHAPAKKPRGPS